MLHSNTALCPRPALHGQRLRLQTRSAGERRAGRERGRGRDMPHRQHGTRHVRPSGRVSPCSAKGNACLARTHAHSRAEMRVRTRTTACVLCALARRSTDAAQRDVQPADATQIDVQSPGALSAASPSHAVRAQTQTQTHAEARTHRPPHTHTHLVFRRVVFYVHEDFLHAVHCLHTHTYTLVGARRAR